MEASSPSLQNLLISIPSQASSFAAAAMGQLIEDQMCDTTQMKRNLKRIGSVVSEWGLGYHQQQNKEFGAAGDMGYPFKEKSLNKISLLMLPVKIRHMIWSRLENKDILSLRAVSSQMQNEMDHEYGLPIVMNTRDESLYFMHRTTTRSCFVTRLDNLLYFNFFLEPEKMKHLRFHHNVPLTAEPLSLILGKFPNLHTISFSNINLLSENEEGKLALVVPTCTKLLLDMISVGKESIFGVELKYNSTTFAIEWKLELEESHVPAAITTNLNKVVNNKVGYINLDMPGEAICHQMDALSFMEKQHRLFELKSQLVGLNWRCYTNVLRQNSKSLIGIHLLSLKCNMDEPFDCGCLSECQKLKFLSISGENSFVNTNNIGGFGFISVIQVKTLATLKNLTTLSLENVYLSDAEFTFLKHDVNNVWIRVSQSMIDKKEIVELKLGHNNNELYDNQDEYGDYFDNDEQLAYYGSVGENHNSILKTFLSDVQPALIKGLLITAWLTFC